MKSNPTFPDTDAVSYIPSLNSVGEVGILASIPHSGIWVPPELAAICTPHHLATLRNTDWHLNRLYDFLPEIGIASVRANFSRYVIDPNRALRQPLVGGRSTHPVSLLNTWGEPIYIRPPTESELQNRVRLYYQAYHSMLHAQLDKLRERHKTVLLLDLHSFMGPLQVDVCLGNAHGQTCGDEVFLAFRQAFSASGFQVALNEVYTGGHIVRHYGQPSEGIHALQIELRYTNYLKLEELDQLQPPRGEVDELITCQKRLKAVFGRILEFHTPTPTKFR